MYVLLAIPPQQSPGVDTDEIVDHHRCVGIPRLECDRARTDTRDQTNGGVTGVGVQGKFDFELTNPSGKKLAVLNSILKVYYKGIEIPNTGYSPNITGRLSGRITITYQAIPKGKALVKLKVKLDDGSELEKELEVDFKEPEPEPEPIPDPISTSGGI